MNNSITEITVAHNLSESRFEVDLGEEKAVLIYMVKAGLFILLHTEVPPSFEAGELQGKWLPPRLSMRKSKGIRSGHIVLILQVISKGTQSTVSCWGESSGL